MAPLIWAPGQEPFWSGCDGPFHLLLWRMRTFRWCHCFTHPPCFYWQVCSSNVTVATPLTYFFPVGGLKRVDRWRPSPFCFRRKCSDFSFVLILRAPRVPPELQIHGKCQRDEIISIGSQMGPSPRRLQDGRLPHCAPCFFALLQDFLLVCVLGNKTKRLLGEVLSLEFLTLLWEFKQT